MRDERAIANLRVGREGAFTLFQLPRRVHHRFGSWPSKKVTPYGALGVNGHGSSGVGWKGRESVPSITGPEIPGRTLKR